MSDTAVKDQSDVVTIRINNEKEQKGIQIGLSAILGTRKMQQDTVFAHSSEKSAIAIVCDGMGGMNHGEIASSMAVETLAKDYLNEENIEDVPSFLREEVYSIDEAIFQLEDNGSLMGTGTTMVATIFQNDEAYWLSIGDSQIYIIRDGEIIAVNKLHNYRLTMDNMLKSGSMTEEQYQENEYRAEALISYLGMGNVMLMEINKMPFRLLKNDIFVLSSDGLYRTLSEDEICRIVLENSMDMQQAACSLTARAMEQAEKSQDNTSVVILKYQ